MAGAILPNDISFLFQMDSFLLFPLVSAMYRLDISIVLSYEHYQHFVCRGVSDAQTVCPRLSGCGVDLCLVQVKLELCWLFVTPNQTKATLFFSFLFAWIEKKSIRFGNDKIKKTGSADEPVQSDPTKVMRRRTRAGELEHAK